MRVGTPQQGELQGVQVDPLTLGLNLPTPQHVCTQILTQDPIRDPSVAPGQLNVLRDQQLREMVAVELVPLVDLSPAHSGSLAETGLHLIERGVIGPNTILPPMVEDQPAQFLDGVGIFCLFAGNWFFNGNSRIVYVFTLNRVDQNKV